MASLAHLIAEFPANLLACTSPDVQWSCPSSGPAHRCPDKRKSIGLLIKFFGSNHKPSTPCGLMINCTNKRKLWWPTVDLCRPSANRAAKYIQREAKYIQKETKYNQTRPNPNTAGQIPTKQAKYTKQATFKQSRPNTNTRVAEPVWLVLFWLDHFSSKKYIHICGHYIH